jgi:membrane protease YdiL (CAAX protease family)
VLNRDGCSITSDEVDTMLLATAAVSALLNLLVVGGLPFLGYTIVQKWRHQRPFRLIAQRAGLQLGERRYLGYSVPIALVAVAVLMIWPPPMEPYLRAGSPQRSFLGLGLGGPAVPMALLYGAVQTGFPEELLFRGLIAGSLSRRLGLWRANVIQCALFLIPHLLLLRVMPELRRLLAAILVGALFVGWLRIKSGSIVGPWIIHASLNTAICLVVAIRSAA